MMGRDFARDLQSALLGPADLFERSFGGKVRDVKPRSGELDELDVAATQTDSAARACRAGLAARK